MSIYYLVDEYILICLDIYKNVIKPEKTFSYDLKRDKNVRKKPHTLWSIFIMPQIKASSNERTLHFMFFLFTHQQ